MNSINNKINLNEVTQVVERYCMDKGIKEIKAVHIFDSKPDVKKLFSIPFNLNYEKHFGPVSAVSFSPFHSRIFLSCSVDGTVKMFDTNLNRQITSFEPGNSEYLHDVVWSPFRPSVFACIGSKGLIYIYDLSENSQAPFASLDREKESQSPG